ncbi:hypothetical protein V6N13_129576 [Hibiscus sabdariffa]
MGVDDNSESKLKPSVVLTGSAKESYGPCIGLVDIGVSQSAFLFRVSLPSIRSDQSQLKCEIQRDGKVRIQGVITQGTGMLEGISSKCEMKVEKFCRPGPFTISFNLPGSVDPRLFSPKFRPDGILEVVVMKSMNPGRGEEWTRVCSQSEMQDESVSIVEAFEQLGLNVVQARVCCNHFFAMEAIVVDQDQQTTDTKDVTQAVLKAIERRGGEGMLVT